MTIEDLQRHVAELNDAQGWHGTTPEERAMWLVTEVGELVREVLRLPTATDDAELAGVRHNLGMEMYDIMRRMADRDFSRATTWAELLAVHDQWVVNDNYQDHWAHRHRPETMRSPAAVLAWVQGRAFAPEELHRAFYATRFGRKVDRLGYVRFRHWRIYGEAGVAGESAAVWLYGEHLTVEFADEPLAQCRVTYQPDRRRLQTVGEPQLSETPRRSAELSLWALGDGDWLKVLRPPAYASRRARVASGAQPALFTWGEPASTEGGQASHDPR